MTFAEFLLRENAVSPEDLLRCVDYRRWLLPFIGTLAVNRGHLSALQVLEVVEQGEQKGIHFGELAVERGFLTREQVDELLAEQRSALESLSTCLQKLGILTRVQIEDLEAAWRKEVPANVGAGTDG